MSNITDRKVVIIDESQIRIVAALVAISIVAYLFLGYIGLLILLIYHFFIQLYLTPLLSPLELIATFISSLLTHNKYSKNTSEKEFAAHLALTIVSVSMILEVLEYTRLASALILLLLVWKLIEVSKNICFGCRLYEFVKQKGIEIVSL
ncbi:DUF4395 domain-containing protein [Sulfurovum sp. XGS-02]|uniref:DUF4395 family protein n=1 Tax=Sulfurovum sp. XGS-02 TaxID=2925411 RepID=UPI00204A2344|nr:DUF4395 family protein [Sulfurovum sp. XGS-02]UPT77888.1 DUF4395 domain-containing protein [Sulfurovum sp. XGS-02]